MNLREEQKNRRKLHVALILDESGSMLANKNIHLNGINEQLQEFRKKTLIDTTITLITFSGSDNIKTLYKVTPIENISDLTEKDYCPSGATALYDAVAKGIFTLQNETVSDDLTNYLVLIISDGEENNSKEFTNVQLADIINKTKQNKNWSINYIGSKQDLSEVIYDIKIDKNSTLTWDSKDIKESQIMWRTLSSNTEAYLNTASSPKFNSSTKLSYMK